QPQAGGKPAAPRASPAQPATARPAGGVKRSGLLPAERPRKRLMRIQADTDPKYGKRPAERTVPELLAAGVVPLDKPAGPTSHQVAAWLRNALGIEEVGHGGTLDPKVTGALPVTINGAVKSVAALLTAGKEYVAVLRLHEDRDEGAVKAAAAQFVGKVTQTPPVRSAVARRPRVRRIYYLDVLEVSGRDVLFRVGCQAGTYVRNLCVDLAKALGTKGHMQELRRTRTGLFTEDDLVTLHDCIDAKAFWDSDKDERPMRRVVKPVEAVTAHLNAIVLRDSAVDAVCHGAPLACIGVAQLDAGIEAGEQVALYTLKGELVALAEAKMTSHQVMEADKGIAATPSRVVLRKGTYPKTWKSAAPAGRASPKGKPADG
ncbi:MAG TPA: RNA-guided pseudouridylation complex pseudouridine synthase subunit Cbf5, partial [Candidatus Thermoplasmatota archaeon]|nr:RNA-guided pseudouridylation complex pseudouridine synthase subunit Cbf5 [Candidatus Thermoplasmatota archaeon]